MPHILATHYFLRLTRARGKRYIREGNALLYDFWYFSSLKSKIKEKFLHVSSRVVEAPTPVSATPTAFACANRSIPALRTKSKYSQQTKEKIKVHSAFSFDEEGAKEKAIKKKTPKENFALCGALTQSRRRRHTRSAYVSIPTAVGGRHRLFEKGGRKLYFGAAKIKLKHKAF